MSLAGGNPRDYAILQVLLQTGIRVSELCALTRSDIDFDARRVHIGNGKGQKARTIELEKKGAQAIKSYLAVRPESLHDEFFLNYQGEPLSGRGVRTMLTKYLKSSGITKKISPHSLRHTFATYKPERGVSPYVLREWLGHGPVGHDADLCPYGQREHQEGNGGDKSVSAFRFRRDPGSLRKPGAHLDNIPLIPASLLPDKEHWQHIANDLPNGDILIVLPHHTKPQRIAHSVASQFRQEGKHVRVIDKILPQIAP